ncbi:transposase [Ellagibacter isourolithinifaciens]|uniref:transposase n=1 Tax=Ellagibacter isourolithinifaciens TaxID=2137581 RepID=UPI002E78656A|nr:transposase [Ellagibacter isourolithinifaciens]MEE0247037.1 transposase [Ellagibacter isourolithinifaciens]
MMGNRWTGRVPKLGVSGQAARARRGAAGARPDGTIDINATIRSMLEGLLNAVMDEQASELDVLRNGYRERGLDTCVGTVTLRIPKLGEGSYFSDDVVRRWSRTDTALASAIRDMLLSVSSAREVEATGSRDDTGPSALAYLDFPREHATWVRTNNVQERMSCEIKRRTRVVQVFPSFDSLVRLVGAVACC